MRKMLLVMSVRLASTARWIGSSQVSSIAPPPTQAAAANRAKMTANIDRRRGRRAKKRAGVSGGSQWRQRAESCSGRTGMATAATVEDTKFPGVTWCPDPNRRPGSPRGEAERP